MTKLFAASGLGLSLSAAGIGLQFQRQPRTDPLPALHALLDVPLQLGTRSGRAWIVFDEFQELFAVQGAEGLLHSHLQHHGKVASYAFAGSERSLLERMFADRGRPFFAQAEVQRLERLPDGVLAEAIEDGFGRTERSPGEVLPRLLALAQGHPQRAMLLAHHFWRATGPGQIADAATWTAAADAALRATAMASETRFHAMTSNQQRVVRAVVEYGSAFSSAALAAVGSNPGSVGTALRQLVGSGDLEHEGPGAYRFVDPLFPEWVTRTITMRAHAFPPAQPDDEPAPTG